MVASMKAAIFNCQCDQMQNCEGGCVTIYFKFAEFTDDVSGWSPDVDAQIFADVYRAAQGFEQARLERTMEPHQRWQLLQSTPHYKLKLNSANGDNRATCGINATTKG